MDDIPSLGILTTYGGDAGNLTGGSLQSFIDLLESGKIEIKIDKVFELDQVPEAHEYMESNKGKGKLVVLV